MKKVKQIKSEPIKRIPVSKSEPIKHLKEYEPILLEEQTNIIPQRVQKIRKIEDDKRYLNNDSFAENVVMDNDRRSIHSDLFSITSPESPTMYNDSTMRGNEDLFSITSPDYDPQSPIIMYNKNRRKNEDLFSLSRGGSFTERDEDLFSLTEPQVERVSKIRRNRSMEVPQGALNFLSDDMLQAGRMELRKSKISRKQKERLKPPEVTFNVDSVFKSAEDTNHFPINMAVEELKEQSFSQGQLTTINLSGVEQLTDMFFYIFMSQKLQILNLQNLHLTGCHKLTDRGMYWCSKSMKTLKSIYMNGCRKLTERTYHYFMAASRETSNSKSVNRNKIVNKATPLNLEDFQMIATSLSALPNNFEEVEHFKLEYFAGCPIISPPQVGNKSQSSSSFSFGNKSETFSDLKGKAKDFKEINSYKVVILHDPKQSLTGIGSKLTNQAKSGPGPNIWSKWSPGKDTKYNFNIYEVDSSMSYSELMLSDGCVVIIPCDNDSSDKKLTDTAMNILRIIGKTPEVAILLAYVGDPPINRDQIVASQTSLSAAIKSEDFRDKVVQKLTELVKTLVEDPMTQESKLDKNWVLAEYKFAEQETYVKGAWLLETVNKLKDNSLLTSLIVTPKGKIEASQVGVLTSAVNSLIQTYPWHGVSYHKDTISLLESLPSDLPPLTPLFTVQQKVQATSKSKVTLSQPEFEKLIHLAHTRGLCHSFPTSGGTPSCYSPASIEEVLGSLSKPVTRQCYIQGLGAEYPCLTRKDVQSLTKAGDSLIPVLEDSQQIMKLVCQPEGGDSHAFIKINDLPTIGKIHVKDSVWAPELSSSQIQAGKFYNVPTLDRTTFNGMIKKFSEISRFTLLWKSGFVLQQGAVTVLVEVHKYHQGVPGLFVAARMDLVNKQSADSDSGKELNKVLYACFKNMCLIVESHLMLDEQFFVAYYPCKTCVRSRDHRKFVSSNTKWYRYPEILVQAGHENGYRCQVEGKNNEKEQYLGPAELGKCVIPNHQDMAVGAFSRCFMCDNCAEHGMDCENNFTTGFDARQVGCETMEYLCDHCGMCRHCLHHFTGAYSILYPSFYDIRVEIPGFIKVGSFVKGSKTTEEENPWTETMSYSYYTHMELSMIGVPGVKLTISGDDGQKEVNLDDDGIRYTRKGKDSDVQPLSSPSKLSGDVWEIIISATKQTDTHGNFRVELLKNSVVERFMMLQKEDVKVTISPKINHTCFVIRSSHKMDKMKSYKDRAGNQRCCNYLPSVYEGRLIKKTLELYDMNEDGVFNDNFMMVCLPEHVTKDVVHFPSYHRIKGEMAGHPLCKAVFVSGGSIVREDTLLPHFVNIGALSLPASFLEMSENLNAVLPYLMIMAYAPTSKLPKYDKLFPELAGGEVKTEIVERSIQKLLQYLCTRLFVSSGAMESGINTNLSHMDVRKDELYDLSKMVPSSVNLDSISSEENKEIMAVLHSKTSQNLCTGHKEATCEVQSRTDINVDVLSDYSHFITQLSCANNHILQLPEAVFDVLPHLKSLEVAGNFLEVLPKNVSNCKHLKWIGLSYNNLKTLPEELIKCEEVVRLDITGNLMTELPACITKMKSIERLYINNLMLRELPESIGDMSNLHCLYASGNCFTKLPSNFSKLKKLTDLALSGVNWYQGQRGKSLLSQTDFEKFLYRENILPWLDAHNEDKELLFKEFDEDFNGVLDVKELSKLSATLFNIFPRLGYKGTEPPDDDTTPSGFPEVICELKNLRYLNLQYQGIVSVPDSIKNLTNLEVLALTNNPHLLSLSGEVGLLPLKRLELEDCPALKTPPREILSRGFKAITAYLRRLATGSVECKRTKLMLVGLGGAGKTSLCRTLMNGDSAKNLTGAEDITDGIDIANWTVSYNDNQIMYSVWDFAGQTVYYNTHQFFLSKRAVYLLLWNVRLGFEHAGLHFWLSSISVHAPKAPIFVIGTHIDQVNKAELPMEELEATYPQISGFYFISSLSGKGIDKLKTDLYTVTLDQDYMGEKIPLAWLDFEKSIIATRQKGNDVIDYNIIEKKAADCGIVDKTEVAQALQFLHDLGAVQHFNNHYLKSRVVINPQWIVDVMACVVSVKESHIKEGRLKQSDLGYIWKDYPAHMHLWLLRLTEEFDLTFPLEGQNVNLVPCLLPEKVAKYDWPEADRSKGILENKMIYKFDHLPAGLFNRAQVRLHQFSDSSLIWKRGSFLKKKGHIALIQQIGDQEMIVMAQGPTPENILFMVHEAFESLIMEFFQGVHYDYQLPCPECLKQGGRDPHLFNASTVRRAVELKAPFLQCLKFFHTIMVTDMQAFMPPDTNNDYDVHMAKTMSGLQEMKKSLATDIFISYCEKDAPKDRSKVIHPATVHDDLTNHGYTCWYPESSSKYSSDALARALIDSSVFLVFMSPNYAKDTQCCDIFQYAKLTLGKPFIVVAVGDDFSWQKSKIGIFLQDVVFVNMINSKKAVYKDKLNELLQKLDNIANTAMLSHDRPECFVSYAWSNSQQACNKGTKYREGALGDADPRELKEFIEEEGKLRCWIDIERVGMTGLFEEIVKGLLQARIVVACISKEYTESQSCQKEFLYALNALKLPVVCAIVGTGDDWKYTSVGMMAFNLPQVSFQMKSEGSKDELLKLINEKMLPEKAKDKDGRQQDRSKSEQNQISFQELYELAQRKFLRQVGHYAASHEMLPYPRLFVVDIVKKEEIKETEKSLEKEGGKDEDKEAEEDREKEEMIRKMGNFRHRDYCVYTLCEYDEGWHSVEDPFLLPEDFGRNSLEDYAPYLARITAIMKHNKDLVLNCLSDPVGKDYVKWLHEMSLVFTGDFMNMYQNLRNEVYNLDEDKKMSSLSRCRLPSGKIKWLCSKHCKEMKATVLSDDIINKDPTSGAAAGLDHMIEYLRTLDADTLQKKFTNSDRAKRTLEGLQKYDTSRDERLKQNQSEEISTPKAASKRMSSLPFSLPFKSRPSKLKTRASQHNMMASISIEESDKNSASAQKNQNNGPTAVVTKSAQLDGQVSNVSRDLVQTDRQTQPKLEKQYNTIEMSQPKQSKPKTSSKTCVLM